jgi:ribonuclease HIII
MAARIGTDEAGKGDFFGCLAVAAVYVDENTEDKLRTAGVKDSKLLSDTKVIALSKVIRASCPNEIVKITPRRYNQLYAKVGNLNKMLAWAHARAIENLLGRTSCTTVITDQFADKKLLEGELMEKGRKITLIQKHRAETDIAVAAASVLARAEFLKNLKDLSEQSGITLPKGATHVIEAARKLIAKHGKDYLPQVAKTHFKTMEKL